jgi:signal transduction histidine kinase
MLEMLKTSAMNLNTTIEDLTNIMIIKNNVNEELCDVSLGDVYGKVESVFTNTILESKGFIETDFQVPYVQFSPVYLESVLINLISNAVHYRSTKRTLLIKIRSTIDENGHTKLIVSDNGEGIDMKRHKDKIFGLYQRFHEHTNGQGLGLFIIKSQISALSGKIEVESEVDKGTTFTITFNKKVADTVFKLGDKHKASSRLVAKMG